MGVCSGLMIGLLHQLMEPQEAWSAPFGVDTPALRNTVKEMGHPAIQQGAPRSLAGLMGAKRRREKVRPKFRIVLAYQRFVRSIHDREMSN